MPALSRRFYIILCVLSAIIMAEVLALTVVIPIYFKSTSAKHDAAPVADVAAVKPTTSAQPTTSANLTTSSPTVGTDHPVAVNPTPVPTAAITHRSPASPTPQPSAVVEKDSQPEAESPEENARGKLEEAREAAEREREHVEDLYQRHLISEDAYAKAQAEYHHQMATYQAQIGKYLTPAPQTGPTNE